MSEAWGAIIVSLITGITGIIGIFIAQRSAKKKEDKNNGSSPEAAAASLAAGEITSKYDFITSLAVDIKSIQATLVAHIMDVREDLAKIRKHQIEEDGSCHFRPQQPTSEDDDDHSH